MVLRIALVMMCGCSFAFVTPPPEHASESASCTESRAAPIADAVLATGIGAAAIVLIATPESCSYAYQSDCTASNIGHGAAQAAGALLLIPTLVYAINSVHGFSTTGECRRLHAPS